MMMAESGQSLGKWLEDTCAIGHCSSSWDTVECDGEILFLWSFHSKEVYGASLVAPMVKNLPECRRCRFNPWVGKIPWRREWLPIPVFLPGESHGQRNLVGYSPWGRKDLDVTEQWTFNRDRVEICFGTALRADGGLSSSQHMISFPSWRLGSEHLQDGYKLDN